MSNFRRHGGLIIFLGLLWLSPLRAEPLVDDPGRFAVDMPQPVKRDTSEINSGLGKGIMHLFSNDGPNSTAYILSYNDYPAGSIAKLDREKVYGDIIKGVVDSLKGVVRSNVAHKLGDAAGHEYILVNEKDKFVSRTRCYFVGDRLYQIMYLGPIGTENSKEALRFLDSFRLLR
ncbi:MAG TPA: hypothetical protein VKC51_09070 [Lacunisphaera sp.]|nr:hypothetical protein [Lacunisphaera sp.]